MQVHLRIYGNVQGVFFRSSAKDVAERLSLVGWIRNNPDGSVEAEANGSKENLEKFLDWCKEGPLGAKVEKVDVRWSQAASQYSDFEILR